MSSGYVSRQAIGSILPAKPAYRPCGGVKPAYDCGYCQHCMHLWAYKGDDTSRKGEKPLPWMKTVYKDSGVRE
jgi:hypothetical protein